VNVSVKRESGDGSVTTSELLLELDFVKRELYSLINLTKSLGSDKVKLKNHIKKMEDEMQMTIDSYMQIINEHQQDEHADANKLRQEIALMQLQIHDSDRLRQQATASLKVLQDEHTDTLNKLQHSHDENARIKDYIE